MVSADLHEWTETSVISGEVVDNLDGTYTITSAILGATTGLLTSGDLFTVALTTDSDGPVDFIIERTVNAAGFAVTPRAGFEVSGIRRSAARYLRSTAAPPMRA